LRYPSPPPPGVRGCRFISPENSEVQDYMAERGEFELPVPICD
jgi:hypothetical protein